MQVSSHLILTQKKPLNILSGFYIQIMLEGPTKVVGAEEYHTYRNKVGIQILESLTPSLSSSSPPASTEPLLTFSLH